MNAQSVATPEASFDRSGPSGSLAGAAIRGVLRRVTTGTHKTVIGRLSNSPAYVVEAEVGFARLRHPNSTTWLLVADVGRIINSARCIRNLRKACSCSGNRPPRNGVSARQDGHITTLTLGTTRFPCAAIGHAAISDRASYGNAYWEPGPWAPKPPAQPVDHHHVAPLRRGNPSRRAARGAIHAFDARSGARGYLNGARRTHPIHVRIEANNASSSRASSARSGATLPARSRARAPVFRIASANHSNESANLLGQPYPGRHNRSDRER